MLNRNRHITVGLLGGSFNPAHEGHRYISIEAIKRLGLNEVWWLVSPQNPLKPAEGMLPLEKRVEIAKNIARHPKIRVTDLEKRFKTRYTYDNILKIKAMFPKIHFVWLMGGDNLAQFPKWHRWQDIAQLLPIVVIVRGTNTLSILQGKASSRYKKYRLVGHNIRYIAKYPPPIWAFLRVKKHPASSTALRKTLDKAFLKAYNIIIGNTK